MTSSNDKPTKWCPSCGGGCDCDKPQAPKTARGLADYLEFTPVPPCEHNDPACHECYMRWTVTAIEAYAKQRQRETVQECIEEVALVLGKESLIAVAVTKMIQSALREEFADVLDESEGT